ncbi:MAG: Gfo/Idh/MocA family oxidoreductase [Bacteroidales bacterium]|nr:Gfo/Idh/MocA family oxidoreductase [Bacteroidales bacterium]MCF8390504.1 Gfo/Idh/MocA family oxidoreductase [Bacteroidales bacterium]
MKTKKVPIVWGVIGAGDVCEVKSVPAIYKNKDSIVKSVMRRDLSKAKDYASRHKIANAYDSADKIFDDPEIDIVYISTPPSTHAEYAFRAAKAGKAAYVEKPMAKTYQECVKMVEAFESANLPLFVAYYRRTLPNFLKVKEIVDAGLIGEIRYVNIEMNKTLQPNNVALPRENWRVNPEVAGGGYFYDLASHQFDFLDFLLGPVAEAKGFSVNQAGMYKAEDMVVASFRFENGVLGSGSWAFNTGKVSDKDLTTIVGSKGQISYPSFGEAKVILETDKNGKEEFQFKLPEHIQANLIQTINDELLGFGKCPSNGISGARTNFVLESILY